MSSPSASTTGRLRRWRVPVLLVVMLVAMALAQALNDLGAVDLVAGVTLSAAVLYCYVWLSQRVEQRRSIVELPKNRAVSGLAWGSLLGAGAFTTAMLIILAIGGWHVTGGDSWKFLATLGVMACTAVTEEVVFRGVIFRIAEERFGSWPALVISAVVFGLIHLAGAADASAGAMVRGAVAIILQGGLMLGAAYMATRALWLPIGIHFAWNIAEAGFGTAVSGKSSESGGLIQTSLSGPTALTGGTFGPEAGLAGILTCLATAALLLRHTVRTDRIVRV
jgi:uncharacterized protein